MARITHVSCYDPTEDPRFIDVLKLMSDEDKVELLRTLYERLSADDHKMANEFGVSPQVTDEIRDHADLLERRIDASKVMSVQNRKAKELSPLTKRRSRTKASQREPEK